MATLPNNPTSRTVVLLRPNEKKRLLKLAKEQQVSSSEILRRSLNAYGNQSQGSESLGGTEAEMKLLLAEMNEALDSAIASTRASRVEIQQNLAEIKRRREQRP